MKKLVDYLNGKKTYIVAGIVAAIVFAQVVGWVNPDQVEIIYGVLAAVGLYAVRDAIKKLEK